MRSTVRTPFVNLFIIIIIIIRPKSSGRVTHDSHKLQTKAIYHSTRHYMNLRELQSDQPMRVLSFPPSVGIISVHLARRRAPHVHVYARITPAATYYSCSALLLVYRLQRRLVIARTAIASMKPFKWRPVCEAAQIAVRAA